MPMLDIQVAIPDDFVDLNCLPDLAEVGPEGDGAATMALSGHCDERLRTLAGEHGPPRIRIGSQVGHRLPRSYCAVGGWLYDLHFISERPHIAAVMEPGIEALGLQCRGYTEVARRKGHPWRTDKLSCFAVSGNPCDCNGGDHFVVAALEATRVLPPQSRSVA